MDAERRQVTVLFTDMVGFTSFSERSGEEAAYTLMRSLSKLMDEAVREQGGFVRGFTDGRVWRAGCVGRRAASGVSRGAQHPSTAQGQQGLASKHSPTISQRC